jgi:hypothetical protein
MACLRPPRWSILVVLLTLAGVVGVLIAGGGQMFSPGALSAREGSSPRDGVMSHAATAGNCAACHVPPWGRESMADRCLNCHTEVRQQIDEGTPLHGRMSQGMQCRNCHGEHNGPLASLTNLDNFDHRSAAFALTGKHHSLACQACHPGNVFKGTAKACAACHDEPAAHKGQFGPSCAQCHSTTSWNEAHLAGGSFNHDRTGFKLTGKHHMLNCKQCHPNNVFKGLAQTCVSCHAEPSSHQGKFGAACAQCHTTATWKGAVFVHSFPINHGQRRGKGNDKQLLARPTSCATCHKDAANNKTYSCYGCHAHSPDRVARQHSPRPIADLDHCTTCHRMGRSHERRRAEFQLTDILLTAAELRASRPGRP